MQLNLTFNKPAAVQFFEGATAVKIKIEGPGKVLFKATDRETGRGIYKLSPRTRGGLGITMNGKFASQFLETTKMSRGTHMAMAGTSYRWIAADAVEGKPSKVVPTARLWREMDEVVSKDQAAPAKRGRKPRLQAA